MAEQEYESLSMENIESYADQSIEGLYQTREALEQLTKAFPSRELYAALLRNIDEIKEAVVLKERRWYQEALQISLTEYQGEIRKAQDKLSQIVPGRYYEIDVKFFEEVIALFSQWSEEITRNLKKAGNG